MEGLTPGASSSAMATAQTQLQTSLNVLSGVTLSEMGKLLDKRLDRLNNQRTEALAAAGLILLLLLGAFTLRLTGRRRRRLATGGGENTRGGMSVPQGGTDPGYSSLIDSAPSYGEGNPTWRERSGALR